MPGWACRSLSPILEEAMSCRRMGVANMDEEDDGEPAPRRPLALRELDDKISAQFRTGGFDAVDWTVVETTVSRLFVQNEATNRALERLGWPPPKFLDSDLWEKVLRQLGNRTVEEAQADIETVICTHYRGDAWVALCEGLLSRKSTSLRQSVLAEICEAHQFGLYAVTIPALFAQIEGLVAEHLAPSGHLDARRWQKIINALTTTKADFPGDRTARKFFFECVLQEFRRPSIIPQGPSRHAILHGADVGYATEENSLKLILTAEYISRLLNQIVVHQDGLVHRTRCLVLEPLSEQYELKRFLLDSGIVWLPSADKACPACIRPGTIQLLESPESSKLFDLV